MRNPIELLFGNSRKKAMKSFSHIVFTVRNSSSRSLFGGAAGSYSDLPTDEERRIWIINSLIVVASYLFLLVIAYRFIRHGLKKRQQSGESSSHNSPLKISVDPARDHVSSMDDATPQKDKNDETVNDLSLEDEEDYKLEDSTVDEATEIDVESFTTEFLNYGVQVLSWKDGMSKPKTLKLTEKGELHLVSTAMASLNSFSPVKVGVLNCGQIWKVIDVFPIAARKIKSASFCIDTPSQKLQLSIQRSEKRFDKLMPLIRGLKAIAKTYKEDAKFIDNMSGKLKSSKTM